MMVNVSNLYSCGACKTVYESQVSAENCCLSKNIEVLAPLRDKVYEEFYKPLLELDHQLFTLKLKDLFSVEVTIGLPKKIELPFNLRANDLEYQAVVFTDDRCSDDCYSMLEHVMSQTGAGEYPEDAVEAVLGKDLYDFTTEDLLDELYVLCNEEDVKDLENYLNNAESTLRDLERKYSDNGEQYRIMVYLFLNHRENCLNMSLEEISKKMEKASYYQY